MFVQIVNSRIWNFFSLLDIATKSGLAEVEKMEGGMVACGVSDALIPSISAKRLYSFWISGWSDFQRCFKT